MVLNSYKVKKRKEKKERIKKKRKTDYNCKISK